MNPYEHCPSVFTVDIRHSYLIAKNETNYV